MTAEPAEELLNVYDPEGRVVGARRRAEAKASGLAVGAVNALLVNARGEVLLQRRPSDKENGGLWDMSVGGHVSAGEDFDDTVVREAGEELWDDGHSGRVHLVPDPRSFGEAVSAADLSRGAVITRHSLQKNLRDVRHAPDRAGVRNVVYHVAVYLGRTDVAIADFRPQADEIVGLRYADAAEVDHLLLRGELSPNMAFLWLTHARPLLALAGR